MSVLLALGVTVLGLVGFGASWDAYDTSRKLRKRGVRTHATCVETSRRHDKTMLLLEYVVAEDGSTRTHSFGPFSDPPLQVGDRTTLVYDAKSPDLVAPVAPSENVLSPKGLGSAMAASALAFLCAASWLTWFFVTSWPNGAHKG
ncbi:hypothetical protein HUT18_14450 [Streptomyces sp. NA04227]|uniref:DUF3592 domain-containing protein n=1 Tax=Streptomyces sp. NA04227 TaxID=2742136 RepID=UPI001590A20B|nr:DUF3592 domain-containing protein [Streptomyces sp. NA04227]QKW07407.1 hypothetical protein HUT18_14450 [Streptomyces sp. NA04227]